MAEIQKRVQSPATIQRGTKQYWAPFVKKYIEHINTKKLLNQTNLTNS